jgi:hypothetical protein
MIVHDVLRRLQAVGFVGKSDSVSLDDIDGILALPVPAKPGRAAATPSPKKRARSPASKRRKARVPA